MNDSKRQRPSAAKRGYDRRWRKAREAYLVRHPLCVRCKAAGRIAAAGEVDHIVPHRGEGKLFSAVWATALAAILTLTAFGCQSGEQRQANELREALVQLTDEIEQLNQEEIAAWRERKEVVDTSPPPRKQFQSSSASIREPFIQRSHARAKQSALRQLESAQKSRAENLAELRQQIKEYTDPELPALAQRVRAGKSFAEKRVESAQKLLQQAQESKKAEEEWAIQASQKKAAPRPPPAAPAPDPEELRQALSKRIDEVDQLYEQWINTLKAVQEAQTDRWEKRWAGDAVTMALMARKQDIPGLRTRLEKSVNGRFDRVESGLQFQKAMIEGKLAAAREKLKTAQ